MKKQKWNIAKYWKLKKTLYQHGGKNKNLNVQKWEKMGTTSSKLDK